MKPARPLAVLLLATAFGTAPAAAQVAAPFDMGIERDALPPGLATTPAATPGAAPAAAPALTGELRGATVTEVPAVALAPPTFDRPIVPYRNFRLAGEVDGQSWTTYLTAAQASAPATLHLAFRNALLVAPEASRLRLLINDRLVIETAVANSEDPAELAVELPAGLLHAGANRMRIEVSQRHRTDCTVQSTYELWTDIDTARTFISFADPAASAITQLGDLRAVGVDATGQAVVNILLPGLEQAAATRDLMRVAEAVAIRLDAPAQVVRVSATDGGGHGPGILSVVIGTVDELRPILGDTVMDSVSGPTIAFLQGLEGPTLLISGRSWADIGVAVDGLVGPLTPPAGATRVAVSSLSWHFPEIQVMAGNSRLSLAELGVPTTEFSGRRFRTGFQVAMPYDLYAQAYGYASLFLDAAYAPEVLPGGHIDVYVNGEIAATTPILTRGGGILRHLEVGVPLRHFKAGTNLVEIEAVLPTASDGVCVPGATASNVSRFALFDTTEFAMPAYARAAQLPDLAALAGAGFPFGDEPLALVLGRLAPETMSAAATFLAQLAVMGGRPIDVNPAASPSSSATPFGLFVGAASQMPTGVADIAGIADTAIGGWIDPVAVDPGIPLEVAAPADNTATFDRWRDTLAGGGGWRGQISSFSDWLSRTFDISLATLRFGGAQRLDYLPPDGAGLLLAQGAPQAGQTSWTVLTAPTGDTLQRTTELLVRPENWGRVEGQVATYWPATGAVEVVPLAGADIVFTQPATPTNLRMVATNWLSKNLLVYGGLLLGLCILLGIATSWLLKSVGRQS
ncbi:MAG: cellulose biosynthesis cyclic di-GMP-binding regulatory protein BcsB [Bauldia sp.]|nr:cellulose biosynthesis cyclic di-GMP-binding regulatory protein BcsB [Bauldia sp.]MCW5716587.1 cellulose biosynthesis cyclic di-GMP-binding regulatory protein BcsB [Bauldia sp.]